MSNKLAKSTDAMLAISDDFSTEIAPTPAAEAARQEIQAAVVLAKKFPRNEDQAYQSIIAACKRPRFADDVSYRFPRGGSEISGPSIYLAREFARVWGNIRHGCDVVADTEDERTIRAWAWDIQTNTKVSSDVTFRKLVQRKAWTNGKSETKWVKPDERDLRELTNKQAAIAKRNCLLELLPSDMVEDCEDTARKTRENDAAQDPDSLRKTLITSFSELGVSVSGLEEYLGHGLAACSPSELGNLRMIYKSIKDGNSTWAEYVGQSDDAPTPKPDVISTDQASQLFTVAKEAGNVEAIPKILKKFKFNLIADVTVAKFPDVLKALETPATPQTPNPAPEVPQEAPRAADDEPEAIEADFEDVPTEVHNIQPEPGAFGVLGKELDIAPNIKQPEPVAEAPKKEPTAEEKKRATAINTLRGHLLRIHSGDEAAVEEYMKANNVEKITRGRINDLIVQLQEQ